MPSLYILAAIFLWSSLGVVVRRSGVPVHIIIFYSCLIAILVQGVILSLKGFRKEIPDSRLLKYPAVLGCVGLVNAFTYYYAFQHTSIANAVLTHYTAPVIVAFLAPVFLKEKITIRIVLAIAVASLGLWIMLDGFSLREGQAEGIIAGLISGFAYAVVIILARVYTQGLNPLVLTFFQNTVIAILLLPFVRELPLHALWSFVLMGILHSTIAPVLYYQGLKFVSANRAAVLGYLEPVSAIIFSMIFLDEHPGVYALAGGTLIVVSGYMTLRGERANAETA
ncbi:MAG: EamA family transporter [Nitrospirae bacterium]|nr:EamA family transporter [Nitrospirota bacterium]